jgi:hypothetical protein
MRRAVILLGAVACAHPPHPRPAEVPLEVAPTTPSLVVDPSPPPERAPEPVAEPEPPSAPDEPDEPPPAEPAALRAARADLARTDEPACAAGRSVVSLARTACFGRCPVYSVAVSSDGAVQYFGERNVDAAGYASWTIDPVAAKRLVCQLQRHGFFALPREYRRCRTDAPSQIVRASAFGQVHVVSRSSANEGCRGIPVAPAWLVAMEDRIDEVAGTATRVHSSPDASTPGARPLVRESNRSTRGSLSEADALVLWRDEISRMKRRCLSRGSGTLELTVSTSEFATHASSIGAPTGAAGVTRCVEGAVAAWGSPLYDVGEVTMHLPVGPGGV